MGNVDWYDVQNNIDKLNEILSKKAKGVITEMLKKAFRYAEEPLRVKCEYFDILNQSSGTILRPSYWSMAKYYWDW